MSGNKKQELSKKNSDLPVYTWSLLYSFYRRLKKSSELKTIKYVLEKSQGTDLIEFFMRSKQLISSITSSRLDGLLLDELIIDPKQLPQTFSAIFAKQAVKKMHLLTLIQSKCGKSGISAGDFIAVLSVDFVKCRDKDCTMRAEKKERECHM